MREINNIGEALMGPDGRPLGGVEIEILLCDRNGMPAQALDIETKNWVLPVPLYAKTAIVAGNDADGVMLAIGEFRIPNMWPTTQANSQVFYRGRMMIDNAQIVIAPLPAGEGPLKWSEFTSGQIQTGMPAYVTADNGNAIMGG